MEGPVKAAAVEQLFNYKTASAEQPHQVARNILVSPKNSALSLINSTFTVLRQDR